MIKLSLNPASDILTTSASVVGRTGWAGAMVLVGATSAVPDVGGVVSAGPADATIIAESPIANVAAIILCSLFVFIPIRTWAYYKHPPGWLILQTGAKDWTRVVMGKFNKALRQGFWPPLLTFQL